MDEPAFCRWYQRLISRSKSNRKTSAELPPRVKLAEWSNSEVSTENLISEKSAKISKIPKIASWAEDGMNPTTVLYPNSDSTEFSSEMILESYESNVSHAQPDNAFDLENPPPVPDVPDEGNTFFVPDENTVSFVYNFRFEP